MNLKISILFFLLFACTVIQAQVCAGSLGDPVINVTFGAGANPGSALPGSVSNYTYTVQQCPQDGFYTVANNTSNCNNSTWHTVDVDHTPGDVNGYMMLVNASFNPGDFYIDTVRNLCANTTYEFAAWILNVLKPSACNDNGKQPNLTFKIETSSGAPLGTYNTGDILPTLSGEWKQYGLFFTTPAMETKIVLRLTNNAAGGCGNDLILDDITFRPCGSKVNAAIDLNGNSTSVDVCQDDARPFTMGAILSAGYSSPAFQWQLSKDSVTYIDITGATTANYTRNATGPGNYYYRLSVAEAGNISSAFCRVVSNTLVIRVNQNPVIQASVSGPVCENAPFKLKAGGGTFYSWTGPNGFNSTLSSPQLTASLTTAGKYYVSVATEKGCKNSDSLTVQVFPAPFLEAGEDQTICEGSSVLLNASLASSYLWMPANGLSSATIRNPVADPKDTTLYSLTITDTNGCTKTDTLHVNVLKKPVAIAGTELQIFEGQSATLNGSVKGTAVNFFWTPSTFMTNANALKPTVAPKDNTTYTLHAVSGVGCGAAEDNVFVRVYKKVTVPNSFSPNGDGVNDDWVIESLATYKECSLSVFNRYGTMVFQSKGYSKRWDGRYKGEPLPWGTYYYTIDLKNGMPLISGWVLIVR